MDFGNLGIGVQIRQHVAAGGQRIEHLAVADPFGERQPALYRRCGHVKLGEGFGDAAMFAVEHLLHLGLVQMNRKSLAM